MLRQAECENSARWLDLTLDARSALMAKGLVRALLAAHVSRLVRESLELSEALQDCGFLR